MTEKRALKEKIWHEKRYSEGKDTRRLINKSKFVMQYGYDIFKNLIFAQSNIEVLDIGCGRGIKKALKLKAKNSKYVGIDISENCILANCKDAKAASIDTEYFVEDIHNIKNLKGRSFDLIVLAGTLHHLDIFVVLPILKELVKEKKGKIIMWEPMGTNPFINIFRFLTPQFRTIDEKPLDFKSISYIRSIFPKTKVQLHTISSLLLLPLYIFYRIKYLNPMIRIIVNNVGYIDSFLGKIPIVRRLAWNILIEAQY